MKTILPNVYGQAKCPACKCQATDKGNRIVLINREEQEYLVDCICGGRYFCMLIYDATGQLTNG